MIVPRKTEKDDPKFERTKFWVATLLSVVAVVVGLVEYAANNFYTVRKPFLEMQADICKSASDAAARVATTIEPADWQKARDNFWALYWGPLAVVEDVDVFDATERINNSKADSDSNSKELENKFPVTSAMIKFGQVLSLHSAPPDPNSTPTLTSISYKISQACQKSIRSVWNIGIWRWLKTSLGWV